MTKRRVSESQLHHRLIPTTISFTATKLEIQFPMLHNELIDARSSSVKISNIFIDTSDGANLFAQFEITSSDHFTKHFYLSLQGCELLQPLNVSRLLLLPPNRSVLVNFTIPLPFYAKHNREKCEGTRCKCEFDDDAN
jgi:hypothetical protein